MLKKTIFFVAMVFLLCTPFFAQSDSEMGTEEPAASSGTSGYPEFIRKSSKLMPGGDPLEVTEYTGSSIDKLVRAKTIVYKDGRISSEKNFDSSGNVSSGVEYVYSDGGLLSEIRGLDAGGNMKWAYLYEYNDVKSLVRETSVSVLNGNEVVEGYVAWSYNADGSLSKRETFSSDDVMTLREVFTYNEAGMLVEETSYYGDETLLKRTVFEYAEGKDYVSRVRCYDVNGLYETTKYEYRQDGKISGILRYGFDSVLKDTETRIYCENKLVRHVVVNADGTRSSANFCLYDWMGNPVFERTSEKITVREFVYPEE